MTDIAAATDGTVYAIDIVATFFSSYSRLLRVDPWSGTTVIVSNLGFAGNALAALSDTEFVSVSVDGVVYRISTTGHVTRIGEIGGGLRSSGDIVVLSRQRIFASVNGGGATDGLVRIELQTGRGRYLGDTTYSEVYGLAFSPYGDLIGVADGDEGAPPSLIKIDLQTGKGEHLASTRGLTTLGGLTSELRLAPLKGTFTVTGPSNAACANAGKNWTYCQHMTGFHRPGGGVQGADDTFAWDMNLPGHQDEGRKVFAVAAGEVVAYSGVVVPGGSAGAVLIEHSFPGVPTWWSGYLHLQDIRVTAGEEVTAETMIGRIGAVGADNEHLHFVAYAGKNRPGKLRSIQARLLPR